MGELYIRPHAERSPTSCMLCGRATGPFLDTNVDQPGYGWVYICASDGVNTGCLEQGARLVGMVEAEKIDVALDEIAVLQADLDQMRVALEEQAHHILVDAREIDAYIKERMKTKTKAAK